MSRTSLCSVELKRCYEVRADRFGKVRASTCELSVVGDVQKKIVVLNGKLFVSSEIYSVNAKFNYVLAHL